MPPCPPVCRHDKLRPTLLLGLVALAQLKCPHTVQIPFPIQVAKYMAEYWASAWERKEGEAAEAAAALHRAEVGRALRARQRGCGLQR